MSKSSKVDSARLYSPNGTFIAEAGSSARCIGPLLLDFAMGCPEYQERVVLELGNGLELGFNETQGRVVLDAWPLIGNQSAGVIAAAMFRKHPEGQQVLLRRVKGEIVRFANAKGNAVLSLHLNNGQTCRITKYNNSLSVSGWPVQVKAEKKAEAKR